MRHMRGSVPRVADAVQPESASAPAAASAVAVRLMRIGGMGLNVAMQKTFRHR